MTSWWRKAGLAALASVSLVVAAALSHLGLERASLAALFLGISGGGIALAVLLKRVGDTLARARTMTRLLQEGGSSSSVAQDEFLERLRASEAEMAVLHGQLDLAVSAIKEGTAQNERSLQFARLHLEERLAVVEQGVKQASIASDAFGPRPFNQPLSDILKEVEALLRLRKEFPLRFDSPLLGGFALSPQAMWQVVKLIREHRPKTIVELGSGLSTLYLAECTAGLSGTTIISVEHDETYLAATRAILERHDVNKIVRLVHAPLVPTEVAGESYLWYDLPDGLPTNIDFVLVDGPPGNSGPLARLPAMEWLFDRLASDAIVVLDDAEREDERAIARSWLQDFGLRRRPTATARQVVLQRADDA